MTPEPGHKKRQHTFKLFLNYINENKSVVSTQLIDNNCIVNPGSQLPFFFFFSIWSHMHARAHALISIYLDKYLFYFILFYFILFYFILFYFILFYFILFFFYAHNLRLI